jgi:beta-mannosidase
LSSDTLLEQFVDITYAYRFGPPAGEVVVARLLDDKDTVVNEAFYFPVGHHVHADSELLLEARVSAEENAYSLCIRSDRFAQAVAIHAPGFLPSDNYFHLAPSSERWLTLRPLKSGKALSASVKPLNSPNLVRVSSPPLVRTQSEHST